MKILLTHEELVSMVRATYGLPEGTEVEIANVTNGNYIADMLINALSKVTVYRGGNPETVGVFDSNGYAQFDTKIPAIKALRSMLRGIGLREAKDAIENWDTFIMNIRRNGLPSGVYYVGSNV